MWALLTACLYNAEVVREAEAWVDADRDGFPVAMDCDDMAPERSPGATDRPLDGIDQDCDGFDTVDADRDGFPGEDEQAYRERIAPSLGVTPAEVPWPDGLEDAVDCDDLDARIYPGAPDIRYDGLDSDCACATGTGDCNDFDFDGDGWIAAHVDPQAVATFAAAHRELDLQPQNVGDCDDDDPTVNPGIDDVWYDGVDDDCGGNNDFDRDGDGYITDQHLQPFLAMLQIGYPDTLPDGIAGWGPLGVGFAITGDPDDTNAAIIP